MGRTVRDCSVAVVGGAGFLGSHLVDHLVEDRACKVVVLDNLEAGRRRFVNRGATFEWADITDSEDHLRNVFERHNVDYVFNYAAHPYVPDSYARPNRVFDVNAFGAMKVIHAAHEAGVAGILQVSSAELYGGPDGAGFDKDALIDETEPVNPRSSYGAAKAAADFFVQARWREARVPCVALRQFNCVGARETHPYIVPEIIGQLWKCQRNRGLLTEVCLGNNTRRDFLSAKTAVRTAVLLLEGCEFGEVYNLGSEEAVHVYSLCNEIAPHFCIDPKAVMIKKEEARVRPWDIWHLQACNEKIRAVVSSEELPVLGRQELAQGIAEAVQHFIDNSYRWCWEE